jgi:hypothetical protein
MYCLNTKTYLPQVIVHKQSRKRNTLKIFILASHCSLAIKKTKHIKKKIHLQYCYRMGIFRYRLVFVAYPVSLHKGATLQTKFAHFASEMNDFSLCRKDIN